MSVLRTPPVFYSGFSPQSIPSCITWLDAADDSVLSYSSGTNISQVRDKSYFGNNFNGSGVRLAVGALGASRPSIRGMVGLTSKPHEISGNASFTYVLVTRCIGGSGDATSVFLRGQATAGGGNGFTGSFTMTTWQDNTRLLTGINQIGGLTNVISTNTTHVMIGTWDGSVGRVYDNGTLLGTSGVTSFNQPSATLNIAAAGNAEIGDFMVFNDLLSTEERQSVEAYLGAKWGIQSLLPAIHPYKSRAPVLQPFLPTSISGCSLWLDAADASTLSLTGSNVTQWRDKSGLDNHSVRLVNTPTLRPNSINGYPAVFLSSNALQGTIAPTIAGTQVHSFMVLTPLTTSGDYPRYLALDDGANIEYNSVTGLLAFGRNGGNNISVFRMNIHATIAITYNTPHLVTSYAISSNHFIAADGAFAATSANSGTTGNFAISQWSVGCDTGRGLQWNPQFYCGEVLVYSRVLGRSQRQQVETYLAGKWGLRSLLPVAHPTRSLPILVPPFVPAVFSNLGIWIDSTTSDAMTITSGTATALTEKSTSAAFAPQKGAVGPTYDTATRGLQFVGTNQMFYFPDTIMNNTASYGFAFVMSFGSLGPQQLIGKQYDYIGGWAFIGFGYDYLSGGPRTAGEFYWRPNYTGPTAASGVVVSQTNRRCLITGHSVNGTNFIFRANGAVATTSTGAFTLENSGGSSDSCFGNHISASFRSQVPGTNNNWTCHEFLWFKTGVALPQVILYEGYLAHKWGLASSLPATHGYKLAPP